MNSDAAGVIDVYMPPQILEALDRWIAEQPMAFSRAEAIRAIVGATLELMVGAPTGEGDV